MSLKDRAIVNASVGFGIGVIVGTVISALTGPGVTADGGIMLCSREFVEFVGDALLAFLIQTFLCGVQGAVGMGGAVVYGIEEWSVFKATATHYCAVMGSFFTIAFFLKWVTIRDVREIAMLFLFMTIPYVMIWLVNFLIDKIRIKGLNERLDALKKKEAKEQDS